MPRRPRLAFAHPLDVRDAHTWSGTPRSLLRALETYDVEVIPISPLVMDVGDHERRQHARYARVAQHYHLDSTPRATEGYARQVERALRDVRPDALLCVTPLVLANLDTRIPAFLWTDATYALLHQTYPNFTNVSAESIARGWMADAQALSRCHQAVYTSTWAADSAQQDFGVPNERVKVVPFGANLDLPPARSVALDLLAARSTRELRLLWMGMHWDRKGGDTAVRTLTVLRDLGVPATLTIVGVSPPDGAKDIPFVRWEGFLSKNTPSGRARLDALLADAHVLLLPSRADCTPMVVGEANAFAVPVVAANVGGMSSVVCEGVNGTLLPAGVPGEAYAERLAVLWTDRTVLTALGRTARDAYDEVLNWGVATRQFLQLLDRALDTTSVRTSIQRA
ncbi:glycosyltransferase family 4 protein [Deinococcus yavapaiensis]|uniref:Glycosyltransferase involved in cell wall biosynthesis n=1 Tax=Deinococcus yavapaiensis KR-236 TaxID=694435 RepID=A0A318SAG5_9DEIO|nr:glycosyltransferase family 4 protein [Deinococcus yavapaiensis]PYE54160.1 glycosyltransferase involved in cell wall biosynthesis [Deinococcus yavapaiensis KR-236]